MLEDTLLPFLLVATCIRNVVWNCRVFQVKHVELEFNIRSLVSQLNILFGYQDIQHLYDIKLPQIGLLW